MKGYCTQSVRITKTNKKEVLSALVSIANLKKGRTRTRILSGDGVEEELCFFSQETIGKTGANFPLSYLNPDIVIKKCPGGHYHVQTRSGINSSLINQIPEAVKRVQEQKMYAD